VSSDGSKFFITVTDSSSQGTLWSIAVAGSTMECSTSTAIKGFKSLVLLTGQTFILLGRNLSTVNGRISKLTLGSTSATWSKSIQWPNVGCTFQESSAIMSSDSSVIYSLISYGSPTYSIFSLLNSSNGDIIGGRYISSLVCGESIDLYLKDGLVYLLSLWGAGYTFTAYDTSTATFGVIYSNNNFLNGFIQKPSDTMWAFYNYIH